MAKNLNKEIREQIIENVVRATNIPELKADLIKRAKNAARNAVAAAQPEGFYEKTANLPKEWFQQENGVWIPGSKNPVGAFTGCTYNIDLDDPIRVAANGSSKVDFTELFTLQPEVDALIEREEALRREISGFLLSCRTIEQVLERMPELEPHVPKMVKPMPLVAPSNLLSTLTQLGFDKTAKQPA